MKWVFPMPNILVQSLHTGNKTFAVPYRTSGSLMYDIKRSIGDWVQEVVWRNIRLGCEKGYCTLYQTSCANIWNFINFSYSYMLPSFPFFVPDEIFRIHHPYLSLSFLLLPRLFSLYTDWLRQRMIKLRRNSPNRVIERGDVWRFPSSADNLIHFALEGISPSFSN